MRLLLALMVLGVTSACSSGGGVPFHEIYPEYPCLEAPIFVQMSGVCTCRCNPHRPQYFPPGEELTIKRLIEVCNEIE